MPPTSPEERPRPSTLRDLPRAAWISARASTPNRPLAVLSVPIYAFSIVPMTLRGGLYLDESRTGTVLFARRRPIRDGLVIGLWTAAAFVLWVASILIVDAVVMLLLGMLVCSLAPSSHWCSRVGRRFRRPGRRRRRGTDGWSRPLRSSLAPE